MSRMKRDNSVRMHIGACFCVSCLSSGLEKMQDHRTGAEMSGTLGIPARIRRGLHCGRPVPAPEGFPA